jgi:hypothetical protein
MREDMLGRRRAAAAGAAERGQRRVDVRGEMGEAAANGNVHLVKPDMDARSP